MSDAIGPGSVVECVTVAPHEPWALPLTDCLRLGGTYIVSDVGFDRAAAEPTCQLVGVIANTTTGWFALYRFRPIWGDSSSLTRLLDVPAQETVDA